MVVTTGNDGEGSFFSRICQPQTLMEAWRRVRTKGSRGGIDGLDPEDLDDDIGNLLRETAARIAAREYVPAPYREVMIPKLNEAREWRSLALPAVIDKVVQQAVVDLIGPGLEKSFSDCSYAYRPGKGAVKACRRVGHILRQLRPGWVATCDIDDFFPSLPHRPLLERLGRAVADPDLVDLVGLWFKAGYIGSRGDFDDPEKGIAQGAVISPLLANLYLDELDKLAEAEKIPYVRYSDNYVLFAPDREQLLGRRRRLEEFLERKLKLVLNREREPGREVADGFDFLGVFFRTGGMETISRAKEKKIIRRLNQLTDVGRAGTPDTVRARLNVKVDGHRRFYGRLLEPEAAFARFDEHLSRRLGVFLARARERGALSTRRELESWCRGITFYLERESADRKRFIRSIVDRAFVTPARKPKGGTDAATVAGRGRRLQARQDRYLRETAGRSSIVVSQPGTAIGRTGRRLVLRRERKVVCELPFNQLRSLAVAGPGVSISSNLLRDCAAMNLPIAFFDAAGRAYAVVVNPRFQAGELTVRQVRMHVNGSGLNLGRRIIIAKCRSQMNLIKYYNRHRSRTDPVFRDRGERVLQEMEKEIRRLQEFKIEPPLPPLRDRIFTAEARVGAGYWEIIRLLLPAEAGFRKRVKRGADDLVNAMLNYGYGILYNRVWQEVYKARLNPEIGLLHAWKEGRPSLVFDLVEEYRQSFVDRPLFSFLTRRGGSGCGLKLDRKSGFLDRESREQVLRLVMDRLSGLISGRGRKLSGEELIAGQVADLAGCVAGRRTNYRPYVMRY